MLGQKLRELREDNGLVQRQIAAELEVDTAYISKVENEEKPLSKLHITKLSKLYKISEKELIQMWLADKIYGLLEDEIKIIRIRPRWLVLAHLHNPEQKASVAEE